MTAITQKIDNYLGGVSRQSDEKKLPGQVRECLNGYPDATFGLTKRPGFKFVDKLETTGGTTFSGTQLDGAKWFYIHRDADEEYIGCITPKPNSGLGNIYIWNALTGIACAITYGSNAQNYLTGARTNYDIVTVQDTSVITNNTVTAAVRAAPTFVNKTRATLILSGASESASYSVTLNAGGGASDQTFSTTSGATDTYDTVLTTIKNGIDALNISGLTVTKYNDSLQLDRVVSSTRTAFSISAKGGSGNNQLYVFQDWAENISNLPNQSFHNHVVEIINTSATAEDNFYSKFIADDGSSGLGYWEETIDPKASPGLDAATMPHELINTGINAFTFKQITWTDRLVGDDLTNPQPSFIGKKIEQSFFHNNRLGFLSQDNVIMSQSSQFYNFFHITARTISDADPIDISCSSIRPASLHSVLPTTQGLILFSKNQQFILFADNGILTPSTALIRSISNLEMDTEVDPIDVGTHFNFISKTPGYTRVFAMQTRGQNESPDTLDIGRIVNEWIPANIDTLISSPQNQFLAMSSQSSKKVYFYRTYSNGEEDLFQAWFNWELPGTAQTIVVDSDNMYAVTKQANQYTLIKANLSQSPEQAIIVNNDGQKVNPCVDLYSVASSVVFDSTNNLSKCYLPYADISDLTPVIVIAGSTAAGTFVESGFSITPERNIDGTGPYFIVPKKNLTSVASNVIVGFKYNFDIELPRLYYNMSQDGTVSDYIASLTIARMKFSLGLSGLVSFKLRTQGVLPYSKTYTGDGSTTDFKWSQSNIKYIDRSQIKVKINNVVTTAFIFINDTSIRLSSAPANGDTVLVYLDEWYSLSPIAKADTYLADDVALDDQSVVNIPIHQRPENYRLRVFNDTPFPVSLNSMMWEGNYSPRFYRRT